MVVRYRRKRYGSRRTRSTIGRVRGRGSYFTDFGREVLVNGGAALGGFAGSSIGGPIGGMIGTAAGRQLGSKISRISGLGAYTIKNNAFKLGEGYQLPSFGDMNQAVIITHREYIGDVLVPAVPQNFNNVAYVLNPGMSSTFPWLSNVAKSFDQYQWRGLVFEFKSTSAEVGSTSTLGMGTVIMATDYDAADPAFSSKLEMENNQYTCSTKPSVSMLHAVECDPKVTVQPMLYVRSGPLPADSLDKRFYDHGVFQIATSGLPLGSSGTIGELWATYKVALYKPQIHNSEQLSDFYRATAGIASPGAFMGTNAAGDPHNSLGTSLSGSTVVFPLNARVLDQEYLIIYQCDGAAAVMATAMSLTLVGCTQVYFTRIPAGVNDAYQMAAIVVRCSSTTLMTVGVTGGSLPAGPTQARLWVTRLDTNINWV